MNIYFIILVIMNILGIGINLGKDGEPKKGNYSFFKALISAIIELALVYCAVKTGF